MTDLSILIPARDERFLKNTLDDLLRNLRGDTEIIVVLDGNYPYEPIPVDPRIHMIYHSSPIGQRAAINEAARLSTARYLMKCDAHCAFDEGFDLKLLGQMQDDWTVVPIMKNLHVFDWVCDKCGHQTYQGATPAACEQCDNKTAFTRKVVWLAKDSPKSKAYCFDATPHFQYFGDFSKRQQGKGDLTESMSLQGSCFMMTRRQFMDLNVCDEAFGSWGSQGIEVACKTWLSGGRVLVNHSTWYAHLFRTQGGDFTPAYLPSDSEKQHHREYARKMFFEGQWNGMKRPLSWLIEKFWPIVKTERDGSVFEYWTQQDLDQLKTLERGSKVFAVPASDDAPKPSNTPASEIIYYTDSRLQEEIAAPVRRQLAKAADGIDIISISLKPLKFGALNLTMDLERGYLTMFRQILAGLEECTADYVFFCEHDVLYHPSHFEFRPPRRDVYYYNEHVYKVDYFSGRALFYYCRQTSGLCADRELLLEHYHKRVALVERFGYNRSMGFEPGTHGRAERVDDYKSDAWMSRCANLDIRHDKNLTPSRWRKDQFRNQRYTKGWKEVSEIEGWGDVSGENIKTLLNTVGR